MLYPLSYEGWEPRGYQGRGAVIGVGGVGWLGVCVGGAFPTGPIPAIRHRVVAIN